MLFKYGDGAALQKVSFPAPSLLLKARSNDLGWRLMKKKTLFTFLPLNTAENMEIHEK